MPNPASTDDVAARWRPLAAAEDEIAETRLEDAWRKLKRDVSDLEERMVGNADLTADVVRVLSDAVIRVLQGLARNGLRKGTVAVDDGSMGWELDASVQTSLYFTDAELGDLSASGVRRRARAFSVQPT